MNSGQRHSSLTTQCCFLKCIAFTIAEVACLHRRHRDFSHSLNFTNVMIPSLVYCRMQTDTNKDGQTKEGRLSNGLCVVTGVESIYSVRLTFHQSSSRRNLEMPQRHVGATRKAS